MGPVLKMMWQCAKVEFSEETETGCVVCEQELVKLTIEKQEQPSPTTPNKPAAPAVTAER